jgi:hypothetical protein
MYGTYVRLDITVHDGWRVVVRAAARQLTDECGAIPSIAGIVSCSTGRCSIATAGHRISC